LGGPLGVAAGAVPLLPCCDLPFPCGDLLRAGERVQRPVAELGQQVGVDEVVVAVFGAWLEVLRWPPLGDPLGEGDLAGAGVAPLVAADVGLLGAAPVERGLFRLEA
jgi:hypothetical protein